MNRALHTEGKRALPEGGWGEGEQRLRTAICVRFDTGSWRASTFFDAHWDHEPHLLHADGERALPLPEGEGSGEGEQPLRTAIGLQTNNGSWKEGIAEEAGWAVA